MNKLDFWTAVSFGESEQSRGKSLLACVDSYFYLGGRKVVVIPGHEIEGREGVAYTEAKASYWSVAWRIASYCTLVIPLIALFFKTFLRLQYSFYIIPPPTPPSKSKIEEEQSLSINLSTRVLEEAEKKEKEFALPLESDEENQSLNKAEDVEPSESPIDYPPSDILSSPSFVNVFQSFSQNQQEKVISVALWLIGLASAEESKCIPEVLISLRNSLEIELGNDDYIPMDPEVYADVTIKFLETIKQLSFEESAENARKITNMALERMRFLSFHGTHIANKESICKHGLSIQHVGDDPQVDRLHRIGCEVLGRTGLFGYRYINCVVKESESTKKYVYVSGSPFTSINYAIRSPEWVSEFMVKVASSALHGNTFKKRDKEAAQEAFEQTLQSWQNGDAIGQIRPLTISEVNEFRTFFNKTWEAYKDFRPVVFRVSGVGMIKQSIEKHFSEAESYLEERLATETNEISKIRRVFNHLMYSHHDKVDVRHGATIPPSQVMPYILPALGS